MHRRGIIHCDLKPSNVMVKRTGQVKIIDIGSAFFEDRPPVGQPCTPEYAAPEVLAGLRATPQSDLASLGYMLLEMLTGSKPFAGLNYAELVEAKNTILEWLPKQLPVDTLPFSESLIKLLRKLVHPNPNERFTSAEQAELSDDGAAEFLRQLVLSDLSQEYATELRQWIAEMETEAMRSLAEADLKARDSTTRLVPPKPAPTMILNADAQGDDSGGFEM